MITVFQSYTLVRLHNVGERGSVDIMVIYKDRFFINSKLLKIQGHIVIILLP